VELFRYQNVPLQTEEALLSQQYQTLCGAMTVEFDGEECTLPQMRKFLLEPDRTVRESAWRTVARRRLADRDKLEELFARMLGLRRQIAGNAGCRDYQRYKFCQYHRFDYAPEDCRAFGRAVEHCVVPLHDEIMRRRRQTMELDELRPWDTSVDPHGRPPLKPFEDVGRLVSGAFEAFSRTDPELGRQFAEMARMGLLDLSSRKGKAPGGYQETLSEARRPFIFMNAVGVDDDLHTLLHEGGHAFHALACADEPLLAYRHAPMEFCEVASMSMELLAGEHLSVFYDAEDLKRSRRQHLETIVWLLPWVATIDSFQDWIYSHPDHSADERRAAWLAARERFGGSVVDWSGLDEERAYEWHRQLHIFELPFYYIEYGIAQLGALQVWARARQDGPQALADYRSALVLGGSRPLPELFEAAGIRFDFSEDTMKPLVDAVAEELAAL
jgi:oligoendopeptidase F